MKISKIDKFSRKKKITTLVTIAFTAILSVIACFYLLHIGPFAYVENNNTNTKINNTPSSTTDSQDNLNSDSKTPINNQDDSSTKSEDSLSASITYVHMSNNQLKIGTVIDSITSDGTCSLTMTKGSQKITDSAGIQALASSSTCKGFSIPMIELSSGTWSISVDITIGSTKAHLTNSYTVE